MPRGRVAYKQYSLYCIGLQAVLATAYYTVPYKALLSIPPWAAAAFHRAGTCGSRPPLHDSAAQAVPKTRAPAVRASKKDHHRSHGAPSYIEVMTLPTGHTRCSIEHRHASGTGITGYRVTLGHLSYPSDGVIGVRPKQP